MYTLYVYNDRQSSRNLIYLGPGRVQLIMDGDSPLKRQESNETQVFSGMRAGHIIYKITCSELPPCLTSYLDYSKPHELGNGVNGSQHFNYQSGEYYFVRGGIEEKMNFSDKIIKIDHFTVTEDLSKLDLKDLEFKEMQVHPHVNGIHKNQNLFNFTLFSPASNLANQTQENDKQATKPSSSQDPKKVGPDDPEEQGSSCSVS